jgi:hypothetical protein
MVDSLLGILACLGLVLATNALFVKNWTVLIAGTVICVVFGVWLLTRVFDRPALGARASCPPLTSTASGGRASCPSQAGGTPAPQECGIDPSTGG